MAGNESLTFTLFGIDYTASKALEKVGRTAAVTGAELDGAGGKMGALGGLAASAGVAIGLAAVAIGGYSVKVAGDFQEAMLHLHTQAQVPMGAVQALSDGVLDLAGKVGFSPDSLAQALYHIASVGIRGQTALDDLKVAAEGANVGGADLVDTTNALSAAVASNIPGVQDMTSAMGALNAIVGSGDMQFQDLNDALNTGVLAVVKLYGVNLTDAGAALATFGDLGIRGADAATDLRMAVQGIAVPAKTGKTELHHLGLTMTTLRDTMEKHGLNAALEQFVGKLKDAHVPMNEWGAIVTEIFGKKAGAGIQLMVGNMGRYETKVKQVKAGAKDMADAVKDQNATFNQQWRDMIAGLEAIGVKIGTWLIPKLMAFGKWIGDNLPPMWARFMDAARPVINWITGTLWPALQKFWTEILPHLKTAWDDLGTSVSNHKQLWSDVGRVAQGVGDLLVNYIIPALTTLAEFIIDNVVPAFDDIQTVLETLDTVIKMWVLGFVGGIQTIVDVADAAFSWIPGLGPKLDQAKADVDRWAADVANAIAGIPSYKGIDINVDVTGAGARYLSGTELNASEAGRSFNGGNLKAHAMGGRPAVGVPAIVGEYGPEIFVPDVAGRIIPNSDMGRYAGGGSGGEVHQHLHINVNNAVVGNERDLVTTITRAFHRARGQGVGPYFDRSGSPFI